MGWWPSRNPVHNDHLLDPNTVDDHLHGSFQQGFTVTKAMATPLGAPTNGCFHAHRHTPLESHAPHQLRRRYPSTTASAPSWCWTNDGEMVNDGERCWSFSKRPKDKQNRQNMSRCWWSHLDVGKNCLQNPTNWNKRTPSLPLPFKTPSSCKRSLEERCWSYS